MFDYNPSTYWKNRGKKYYQEFRYNQVYVNQEKSLIKFMEKHIPDSDSILEVGCGFGRISNLIMECFPIKKYDAIDLSPDQISKARSMCDTRINFMNYDIEEFSKHNKLYYDLILAVEVLMHVKPDNIIDMIKRLLGMGKHLLHIDYCVDVTDIKLKNYNFNHDYFKIYEQLGLSITTERIYRQVIFYV